MALAFSAYGGQLPDSPSQTPGAATPVDCATPVGLPSIGLWMVAPDGLPARWLGEVYRGKQLREPINVLIVDRAAASADAAKLRLLSALVSIGYPDRFGHSDGYQALIGGVWHPQFITKKEHAFSDAPFELDNNHGRVFGPAAFGPGGAAGDRRAFLFVASFSRENIDPITRIKHRYHSFNRARDDVSQRLHYLTNFAISAFVGLDNTLIGDEQTSTGDHDGIAVLLVANR